MKKRFFAFGGHRMGFWPPVLLGLVAILVNASSGEIDLGSHLAAGFRNPPVSVRPWVYWFFMDGNLSREGITADLEGMQQAGIGGCIIMEVDVGVARGPVHFMSPQWQELFKHAVKEAERLGLQITLNAGPGWTGSGGPWVRPEQSMQHLVASETNVIGPGRLDVVLPRPAPRPPFFGEAGLPPELVRAQEEFYRDVAVLAFPTPAGGARIEEIDEKALYVRAPYSSQPGVKPFLPAPAAYPALPAEQCIDRKRVVDLTSLVGPDGRLHWSVPEGKWTILRFGRTSTGQNTRPAPLPGLGLESDKFDRSALEAHFQEFIGKLLSVVGSPARRDAGWTMLHIDSWEMGAQNWTARFRDEFQRRRGYDPLYFLPVMTGTVVDGREVSERFLWDLRQTAQELVIENHARHLKTLAHRHGMGLSIEPYDMNPCSDLSLGGEADVPMCEFWARGYGFKTEFSVFEATSIAHTLGLPVAAAESFTSDDRERWQLYPGALKAQGDWAMCAGVNRIVFHRYQHQPWLDRWPGMTMGPYGVHWERTQTWWGMAHAFHQYLARCQFLLQRGRPVADICYLAPEGAPHVFRPPKSALLGDPPYRPGYNFDGCAPEVLIERGTVKDGRIELAGGMSYAILVLPECDTMTPRLLRSVRNLVQAGATVLGVPPKKSPSLSDYPQCDEEVKRLASEIWGVSTVPSELTERRCGKGRVFWGGPVGQRDSQTNHEAGSIARASWIWHPDGNPAAAAPVGRRYFQRTLTIDGRREIESALFALTADNSFELVINGKTAGNGDNFHQTYVQEVADLLRPGTNLLAIMAENGGTSPNPAGLIGALSVKFRDGGNLVLTTDGQWKSATRVGDRWSLEPAEGAEWRNAIALGPFDMGPWNKKNADAAVANDMYPPYAVAAGILAAGGIAPDFESDHRLGYTHRRDGDCEVYFVANPEPTAVAATATFRVAGRQPELWDPITGDYRDLRGFTESSGRTTLKLRFDPRQSYFILFRKSAQPERSVGSDYPEFTVAAEVSGPWEVQFQPGRGAPERIVMDRLIDLAEHPDNGVRHFAGTVTYRAAFDWKPAESPNTGGAQQVWIDLGRVEVIASVRLNGRDLGVAWTSPFRVDASPTLRPGRNELEVCVANLWPNRLIADAALPETQRLTWTTWNPFKPDSALLPSGLFGPVTLQISRTQVSNTSRP